MSATPTLILSASQLRVVRGAVGGGVCILTDSSVGLGEGPEAGALGTLWGRAVVSHLRFSTVAD